MKIIRMKFKNSDTCLRKLCVKLFSKLSKIAQIIERIGAFSFAVHTEPTAIAAPGCDHGNYRPRHFSLPPSSLRFLLCEICCNEYYKCIFVWIFSIRLWNLVIDNGIQIKWRTKWIFEDTHTSYPLSVLTEQYRRQIFNLSLHNLTKT